MYPALLLAKAQALARYHARRNDYAHGERVIAAIMADLHAKQYAFVDDDESPVKTAVCGRRAGKTKGLAANLWKAALRAPHAYSCYIGLTTKGAKKLMWPELLRMNDRYGIGAKPHKADLTFELPNGHTIFLGGADTEGEIEKFRSYKYKLATLDECGSMGPWIQKLIVDILEPACVDVDGQIAAAGTPGPVCDGFFWEMSTPDHDESVPTYHWTCLDNPFIPGAHAWLEKTKKRRGWDDNNPTYLREWMGIWVPDTNQLCFSSYTNANDWNGVLPDLHGTSPWEHVLGIDLGYDDATAFTLLAEARTCDTAYVRFSYKETHMEMSAIFQRARDICATKNVRRIVVDASGGGGKNTVADWRKRFSIPVHLAKDKNAKNAKKDHIALINNAFSERKLMLNAAECGPLIHEAKTVCWDDKRKKPDPRYPNDCADSLEYAYMDSIHYAGDPAPIARATMTEEEKIAREAEELELREVKRMRGEQRRRRRRTEIY